MIANKIQSDVAFGVLVRPCGRVVLIGRVHDFKRWRGLPDGRLMVRVCPAESTRGGRGACLRFEHETVHRHRLPIAESLELGPREAAAFAALSLQEIVDVVVVAWPHAGVQGSDVAPGAIVYAHYIGCIEDGVHAQVIDALYARHVPGWELGVGARAGGAPR